MSEADKQFKSTGKERLFVIEIKQPQLQINTGFQKQLFSYMRQLKLEYGLLIGQSIQIFYDGVLSKQEEPVLLDNIKFERNSEKGKIFVELFCKENFSLKSLQSFALKSLEKINREKDFKQLTNQILSEDFKKRLFNLMKQEFISDYDGELIESVLDELKVEISSKNQVIETSSNNNNTEGDSALIERLDQSKHTIKEVYDLYKPSEFIKNLVIRYDSLLCEKLNFKIKVKLNDRGFSYYSSVGNKVFIWLNVKQKYLSVQFFTGNSIINGINKANWIKGGDYQGTITFRIDDEESLQKALLFGIEAHKIAEEWAKTGRK
jgi:hypothetical protein